MSHKHDVRMYAYVNHPYSIVRDSLKANPVAIFEKATSEATNRAESLAGRMRVEFAGLEVGVAIAIVVDDILESQDARNGPVTYVRLRWQAQHAPNLFPVMTADLAIYALSAEETQLDFRGGYTLPLGIVGSAIDSVAGHRIAEASVQRFVNDVADHLKKAPVLTLAKTA